MTSKKKVKTLPRGHCSRCGGPPSRKSGFSWCKTCDAEIRGENFSPSRDEVIINTGGRISRKYEEGE